MGPKPLLGHQSQGRRSSHKKPGTPRMRKLSSGNYGGSRAQPSPEQEDGARRLWRGRGGKVKMAPAPEKRERRKKGI
uniref:Uncharacterized protein n=1 Tax=Mustela putorius furo TaxID=9669 RepID=M3YBW5_MUSPF